MMNKNTYYISQLISNLKQTYVILTNGSRKVANVAVISDAEVVNNNDLILRITGNMKNDSEGFYIYIEETLFRLKFEIVLNDISRDILTSYMQCYKSRIDYSYELFKFCRLKDKIRQVRQSNTGGIFLDWYNSRRKTNFKISSFDGIWFNGKYLRVLPVQPPSLECNMSEVLFESFNGIEPFTSIGSYKVYVSKEIANSSRGYFEEYTTINGIVIPDIKTYKCVTREKIIAIDKDNNEFVINLNKKEDSVNIA